VAGGHGDATLVILLAGGQGERLYPLTKRRAKPAVPFGGTYRIIDFTLANCINSGLRRVYVLTQHKSLSLDRHLRARWSVLSPGLGEFIQTVPPQLSLVSRWYEGNADAVFQNLDILEDERPREVLVVSGDHVYRLDYGRLIQFHRERDAALTVACTEVPVAEATRMGVVEVDARARVTAFHEKPACPTPMPGRPSHALANMGVYLFDTEPLVRALIADAKSESKHDFGFDIIPRIAAERPVFAFDVIERCPPRERYWQDVGTLDSYFDATMDLLQEEPAFELFDADWPAHRHAPAYPPAIMRNAGEHEAGAVNSILAPGCIVSGARIVRSVLSSRVRVERGARVEDSILLPGVQVGAGCELRRVIVDENAVLPPGTRIGYDAEVDRRRFLVTARGIAVVPDGTVLTPAGGR